MMIKVADVCGLVCVDPQDGERLHEALISALGGSESLPSCFAGDAHTEPAAGTSGGQTVELDFDGVTTLTSSFLNAAIGRLYEKFDPKDLACRLTFKRLDRTDEGLLRLVQNNAIRYYSSTPTQQAHLLDSGRQATESC
jgi:hypothetical protein